MKKQEADGRRQEAGRRLQAAGSSEKLFYSCLLLTACCLLFFGTAAAQVGDYENRPVAAVEVVLEGSPAYAAAQAEFLSLVRIKANAEYSAVAARQSLQDLFASDRVASALIEISEVQPRTGPIRVRFAA